VTDTKRYPARVFWSDEDEGFVAVAPDLPGCSAFGKTQQEAIAELQDAIEAWIKAAQSAGNPIPVPSRPESQYSGKVLVRMPRTLHSQLAEAAKMDGASLNQYIVYLLTWATTRHTQQEETLATINVAQYTTPAMVPFGGTVVTIAGKPSNPWREYEYASVEASTEWHGRPIRLIAQAIEGRLRRG
jgi:predicted RNase H-like HicB family nuclease